MSAEKKYPLPSSEQENIEEAIGCLWQQQQKAPLHRNACLLILKNANNDGIFDQLLKRGLIVEQSDKIVLTAQGEQLGREMVRRHRLAERLLSDVLALPSHALDPNACQLEHILSPEVVTSICTLLGHPKECPHGTFIPPGECCQGTHDTVESIICSLDKLHAGQSGKIAYLTLQSHPDLHKLLSLGLIPGSDFSLHQTYPTFVLESGQTTIALEKEIAEKIFVRK